MKMSLFIFFLLACSFTGYAEMPIPNDTLEVTRIWDEGRHNAFTDLIRFRNRFYCTFREGESHVGSNEKNGGNVRVISSRDLKNWTSVALLHIDGIDLRDAKLSVTPDDKLMITMAGAVFKDGVADKLYPMVSFSDKKGNKFSDPERATLDPAINPSRDWIWRVTWHKGVGYGVNYQLKENGRNRSALSDDAWLLYLVKTKDGKHYEKVSQLEVKKLPNEATVRFDENDRAFMFIRKEEGDKKGVLAESGYPYTSWVYHDLDYRLGGPNFLFYKNDYLLLGTRVYEPKTSTGIYITDRKGNKKSMIELPGAGDQSYPGMLMYRKKLLVSYYSSHEGKSNIYLAKIPLTLLDKKLPD